MSARRSRTALLAAAVALSAGLIAAVACAMTSVQRGVKSRVEEAVGVADVRVEDVGRKSFDAAVLKQVGGWPEVAVVAGRGKEAVALKKAVGGGEAIPYETWGVIPELEYRIRPPRLETGRGVQGEGEIVIDSLLAKELGAALGDTLAVEKFGDPVTLKVVGISKPPAFASWLRPEAYVSLDQLGAIVGKRGRVREVDILVKPGVDPERVAEAHAGELSRGLVLRVSSKVTSGLDKNVESSRIGMIIASVMSFLSAAFIIMTGLTTNVTEKQRELAVVRCIGGTKWQLAESQIAVGVIVGLLGAIIGVPLGVVGAAVLVAVFPEQLPSGFEMSWFGAGLAVVGSVAAGVAGAAWPAWRASRSSPIEALQSRARVARVSGIVLTAVAGACLATVQILVLSVPRDAQAIFWGDVTLGMPAMVTGYFLLAVPVGCVVTLALGGVIGRVMRIPRGVLTRTVLATPYRHGFTAGAMMVGLALLIAIWTNGRAVMRDWLDAFKFPDAFVVGENLSEETERKIDELPGVIGTCAITTQPVKTDAFGVRALSPPSTTFVAFEPGPFFEMTRLEWMQPKDAAGQERAVSRLKEGGAVLVAREFLVTRGLGVGDRITLKHEEQPYEFEIVGVVSSPGLDIVGQFFKVGESYLDNAVNAVFGSRGDLKRLFGNDGITLIQIAIDPKVDDAEVMEKVRRLVGVGVLSAGSGREIKAEISKVLSGSMAVMSTVAIGAMLVSCFGVANLIVAGIQARQFEFGVLRAIGAQRGQVARLVMGEAVIIAITACLLGTVMGTQGAWAGQRMYQVLLGLVLSLRLPVGAVAFGWVVLVAITLGAALPAVVRLSMRPPRELLGAMKG
ncbi:MAG: ABC transporter permease [Phycisphaeraceae bacterium]|nr:ABC transporter permease [Phycisphaeraceae bacterium]